MQNNPAGNSKHFCKSVKFLNGKRASTIPVTHHGQAINYSRREQKADTFNHFFQSCAWITLLELSEGPGYEAHGTIVSTILPLCRYKQTWKLYVSHTQQHLEYACPIWDPSTVKDHDLVENVLSFAS